MRYRGLAGLSRFERSIAAIVAFVQTTAWHKSQQTWPIGRDMGTVIIHTFVETS